MKRPFFRQPATVSAHSILSIAELRTKLLGGLLAVSVVLGFVALLITLPDRLDRGEWWIIVIFVLALGWLGIVSMVSQLSYRVRAGSLIAALALIGFVTLLVDGLPGNGRLFLLALPLAAALLVNRRAGYLTFGLSLVVFALIGWLAVSGVLAPSPAGGSASNNLRNWLTAGAGYALIEAGLVIAFASLSRGLENSISQGKRLLGDLDIERARMEHRVLQRTQDLEHRLFQIRTAAEIVRSMAGYLKSEQLLPGVVNLIQGKFNLYYVGVFLLDERGELAVLQAATGEAGAAMLQKEFKIKVDETSLVGWVIQRRQARIGIDVGFEAVHFNNPLLPITRSELVLPLIGGHGILGALTVQSSEVNAFDMDDLSAMQGIADALAAALDNTRLFQQLEKSLDEIQTLHRQYLYEAWKEAARQEENSQFETKSRQTAAQGQTYPIRIPLMLRDLEIGQLTLEMDRPQLNEDEQAFVQTVTTQAAIALENVRLLEKNQRQTANERMLSDISLKARSSTDLETILRVTVRELGQALGASDGFIRLAIPGEDEEVRL